MSRGGARAGAGRPSTRDKFAPQADAADVSIANALDRIVDRQIKIADDGFERVETVFKAAGSFFVDGFLIKPWAKEQNLKGEKAYLLDRAGNPIMGKVLAFPDLPPEQLVPVQRNVIETGPDAKAGQYLIDRMLSKASTLVDAPPPPKERRKMILPANGTDKRGSANAEQLPDDGGTGPGGDGAATSAGGAAN